MDQSIFFQQEICMSIPVNTRPCILHNYPIHKHTYAMSHGKIVYQLGDERCSFCCEPEMISHLLFDCTMSKYVRSLVALVLGVRCRPISLHQLGLEKNCIPGGEKFYMPGLAAICWGSGLQEMEFASRKRWSDLLQRSFAQPICFFHTGQVYKSKKTGNSWGRGCGSSQEYGAVLPSSRRRAFWVGTPSIWMKTLRLELVQKLSSVSFSSCSHLASFLILSGLYSCFLMSLLRICH